MSFHIRSHSLTPSLTDCGDNAMLFSSRLPLGLSILADDKITAFPAIQTAISIALNWTNVEFVLSRECMPLDIFHMTFSPSLAKT